MPAHDIIDNRSEKLSDHIRRILPGTERARFAVGYFFLSGLECVGEKLKDVSEVRLLIGNTTNRETIEQVSEGYKKLDLIERAAEGMRYPRREDIQQWVHDTADNVRQAVELMDQTDDGEEIVRLVVHLIQEQRLKVRVYTKGRLHAKAYVFDYKQLYDVLGEPVTREENGLAIVGSSNLTLSGIEHNTELNVLVHGNSNHQALVQWFEELWEESPEFDDVLMQEIQKSWAVMPARPYDIYMKTLYSLVSDRLDEGDAREILWSDEITEKLADFQKAAVRQAVRMTNDYGGCFVADVVGMGKSFIGAAILKHFERTERALPLVVCPPALVEMWESYNAIYGLNAVVESSGMLQNSEAGTHDYLRRKYPTRDFVLIDESHNFRHSDTQRYAILQEFTSLGKKCVLLTATPRNKSAKDVYNQIKLFHPEDSTLIPIDPPNLRDYFRQVEERNRRLQDLLRHILIRRTRMHILRFWGYDSETNEKVDPNAFGDYISGKRRAYVLVGGRHQFFPRRKLETIEYSIEDTYQGLYQRIRGHLGRPRGEHDGHARAGELTYARYGLWHYVLPEKQKKAPYNELHRSGSNLRGLVRVLLFKRFESSVYAFQETLKRLIGIHERFQAALEEGIVPAGEEAQYLLYESDQMDEPELFDALRAATGKYSIQDFKTDLLSQHISQDIDLLGRMYDLVKDIGPEEDSKLQTLMKRLESGPMSEGKCLIFTQYSDTAKYIYRNLNPEERYQNIEVIYSGDKNKTRVVGRFAPQANPSYQFPRGESQIKWLVATDVLAEGLNLQDCDKVVNYDLHWNPVRLIQRFGRIDRIGSEYDTIYGFNFLPEAGLERQLGLRATLSHRIAEIHETIGEDAAILDSSEQLNTDAMYAIYEGDSGQLSKLEDQQDELIDLNEAEEYFRQLRSTDTAEYDRIANLRDGIRSAKASDEKGIFVFCQADRYQQLYLVDESGNIVTREVPSILSNIKCSPATSVESLPQGYNAAIMKVKKTFDHEVRQREAEIRHTLSLTQGQRYIIRELGLLFKSEPDNQDLREEITALEHAFRRSLTSAVKKEINLLRRNSVIGRDLLRNLTNIYYQHGMHESSRGRGPAETAPLIPRIVCSEALVENRRE